MSSINQMHYTDSGSGDAAVVFLHYFGSAGGSWKQVTERLQTQARCIVPDLRGFGVSGDEGAFRVDDYANDVAELVRSLGLKNYLLAGHSMGGKIALAVAARQPEGLRSLVLVAPSPPTPEPMDEEAREELRSMFGDRDKIEKHLNKISAQGLLEEILHRESAQHLHASAAAWNAWIDRGSKEDISSRMAQIRIPVSVIGGAQDEGITKKLLQEEVVDRLSDAKLEIIEGAGHLLPLEQPAHIASRIEQLLRKK